MKQILENISFGKHLLQFPNCAILSKFVPVCMLCMCVHESIFFSKLLFLIGCFQTVMLTRNQATSFCWLLWKNHVEQNSFCLQCGSVLFVHLYVNWLVSFAHCCISASCFCVPPFVFAFKFLFSKVLGLMTGKQAWQQQFYVKSFRCAQLSELFI